MGHAIEYDTVPEKGIDKKAVEDKWNRVAAAVGIREGCMGLPSKISWLSDVLDTRDDAEAFLERCARGKFYPELAVRYHQPERTQPSKRFLEALEIRNEARRKMRVVTGQIHYATAKSEFIGCKQCRSKLARTYLKTNNCPVCGVDMRPASKLEEIRRLREKLDAAEEKLAEIERKDAIAAGKNAPLMWLIRVEYHT